MTFFKIPARIFACALAISSALLVGCAGPQINDYAAEKPVLDMRQYFNGTIDAYGVFTDRSGKVVKRRMHLSCR